MSDWDAGGEPVPVERVGGGPGDGADGDRTDEPERGTRGTEDPNLAELTADLEATLRELRRTVDTDTDRSGRVADPRRQPPEGLPRPPSPGEVLRFTESYTIPTVIAALEAAVRALELLAATIRLLDGRDPRGGSGSREDGALAELRSDAGDRAARTGRAALERVDEALGELQRSYEGEPEDPTARRLLADARALRSEIDDRLSEAARNGDESDDPGAGEGGGRETGGAGNERATVDVEAELETLRRNAGRDDGGEQASPDDGEGRGQSGEE